MRGDKILVFSDNIFVLEHYAKMMKKVMITCLPLDAWAIDEHCETQPADGSVLAEKSRTLMGGVSS